MAHGPAIAARQTLIRAGGHVYLSPNTHSRLSSLSSATGPCSAMSRATIYRRRQFQRLQQRTAQEDEVTRRISTLTLSDSHPRPVSPIGAPHLPAGEPHDALQAIPDDAPVDAGRVTYDLDFLQSELADRLAFDHRARPLVFVHNPAASPPATPRDAGEVHEAVNSGPQSLVPTDARNGTFLQHEEYLFLLPPILHDLRRGADLSTDSRIQGLLEQVNSGLEALEIIRVAEWNRQRSLAQVDSTPAHVVDTGPSLPLSMPGP